MNKIIPISELLHNYLFSDYKKYEKPFKVDNKIIGKLFDLKTFVDDVNNKMLTGYDGWGYLVYRDRVIDDATLYLMSALKDKTHVKYKNINLNLLMMYYVFKNEVQIIWYNK